MSAPHLELFKFTGCDFCQKVLTAIQAMSIKVTYRDIITDPKNLDYHIEKTGRRTVPCLYIDGKPMFESDTIITWLEENKEKLEKEHS